MKKIVIHIISQNIDTKKKVRIQKFVEFYFKQKSVIVNSEDFNHLIKNSEKFETVVSLKNSNQTFDQFNYGSLFKKIFYVDIDKNRILLRTKDKNINDNFKNVHIFSDLHSDVSKGFFYFPYGFTYKLTGLGNLDEFGFRINCDINKLNKRDSRHIVISIFGGSAVWSIECLENEMFSNKLEEMLNNDSFLKKKGYKFTCLNFGQSAATIFQSTIYYLLFSSIIKPEFVISHDGWNDLVYGSYTDKYLLREKRLTYTYELEEWALNIYGKSHDDYKKKEILPYPVRNIPSDVITSFLFRKNQFKKIVDADGGYFINGIQPTLKDKKDYSSNEKRALEEFYYSDDNWKFVRKNMSNSLDKVLEAYESDKNLINFKKIFVKLNSNSTHFIDNIHLTPEGDEVIAKEYMEFIKKRIKK